MIIENTEATRKGYTGHIGTTPTHLILHLDDNTCVQIQLENISSSVYTENKTESTLDIKIALTLKTATRQLLLFAQTQEASLAQTILRDLFTSGKIPSANRTSRVYQVTLTRVAS